jgi:hypothetical protein
VALYCPDLAEIAKASTITRRLATIAKGHTVECYESPCSLRHAAVAEVLSGIRRSKGTMAASKSPLMVEDLRRIIGALPTNTIGTRDVALLLLGYSGGFRRSELAALAVEDVEDTTEGLTITIRRGKADQEGARPSGRSSLWLPSPDLSREAISCLAASFRHHRRSFVPTSRPPRQRWKQSHHAPSGCARDKAMPACVWVSIRRVSVHTRFDAQSPPLAKPKDSRKPRRNELRFDLRSQLYRIFEWT